MNYESKIIEFIEGTLSSDDEREFLYEMMENEESRKSFREILRIEKSFKHHFPRNKPSDNLKKTVFASVGFADSKLNNANQKEWQNLSKFNNKYLTHIMSAVIGAIIAGVFFFTFDNEKQSISKSIPIQENKGITIEMNVPEKINDFEQTEQKPVTSLAKPKSSIKHIAQSYNSSDNTEHNNSIYNSISFSESVTHHNRLHIKEIPLNIDIKEPQFYADNAFALENKRKILDKLYFEFGGSESIFTQKTRIEPAEVSSFINKSIGAFYKLNDFMNVGILVKNENFYLDYETSRFIQNDFRIEQQPILFSGNLAVEFYNEFGYGVLPFVRFNTGYSKTGLIFGLATGIGYKLTENIELFGNAGYKTLLYQHRGKSFISDKYFINYGIKYHINN